MNMTNIILCGGNGTRLWPISRTLMPKQFVKFFDEKSLFQLTVERNSKVCESQFIMHPFFKTSKTTFLIPSSYDTDCNSFPPLKSRLLI